MGPSPSHLGTKSDQRQFCTAFGLGWIIFRLSTRRDLRRFERPRALVRVECTGTEQSGAATSSCDASYSLTGQIASPALLGTSASDGSWC